MKVDCEYREGDVVFLLSEVEPGLEDAVRALAFRPMDGGFGQIYPAHPQADRIYRAFRRHVEELVNQKAGLRPVPWEAALAAFCEAVDGQGIDWWLTGSAALAIRGLPVAPGDLDLVVALADAPWLEALLIDQVIEPPRPGFVSQTFTRAFLHASVEWIAGVDERADRHLVGDVGPTAAARLETVTWQKRAILVPPLDLQLAANEARGLAHRAALIRGALSADGSS